jgi:hypothetical protein
MTIKIKNEYAMTNDDINQPFMLNDNVVGVVTNVTPDDVTVFIFENFLRLEKMTNNRDNKIITTIGFQTTKKIRENLISCPECERIAEFDLYFSAYVCRQCGWMSARI